MTGYAAKFTVTLADLHRNGSNFTATDFDLKVCITSADMKGNETVRVTNALAAVAWPA